MIGLILLASTVTPQRGNEKQRRGNAGGEVRKCTSRSHTSARGPRHRRKSSKEWRNFVRKDLEGRFKDEFVFDQVIANPELDHYGDEFLHIYIIFDGNQKNLDPRWTNGIEGRLLDQLPDGELPHTPGHSFISKSEWKRIYKERIQ